jgi:glycosyl-4,4'-diaponeurosporenoate acyltransferase
MTALVWAANLLGWPVIHLSIASTVLRLPPELFAQDSWLTAPRHWERDGRLYRDRFGIRNWKFLLPDAAPWFGGFAKKKLRTRDPACIVRFLIETRRAEVAHWCMLVCIPVFFLWNPTWASCLMSAYGLAANLPCILAQRYNRFAFSRLVRGRSRALVGP